MATQVATHIAAATATDVSIKAWQRTVEHVGKNACENSSLRKLLIRFVAYAGSTSGVEQTFSQCLAQFRHLRNYSVPGLQRVLVLAGTRGQAREEDLALYSRARQIWAENFGAPRRPKRGHIFSAKHLRRLAELKVRSQTEAAARRRRTMALASLPAHGADDARNPDTAIASSSLWGAEQERELKRQEGLQKERKLDAADMGAAEADPVELRRYQAKQKQTHNRYVQKRLALTKSRRQEDTTLKPGTPTWTDDANWDELMRSAFFRARCGVSPASPRARAFVVVDVAAPPRLVDLAASLNGGLVASVAHLSRPPGPILRHGRALSQRRAVWISRDMRGTHPPKQRP